MPTTPVPASATSPAFPWADLPSGPLNKDYAYVERLTAENALAESEKYIATLPPFPEHAFAERGIVICGGGVKYFTCAWVNINMLRRLGCTLPIQLWYLGEKEMSDQMKALVAPLGVECIDARKLREKHPARILNGWEVKAYAIIYSRFREVLLLDADNVPVTDPAFLFESEPYRQTGAIFWPDYGRLGKGRAIWNLCGIPYRNEREFESGQIVIDKARCWHALCLAFWYNEYSNFFYQHIHGDKETFHLAFRKLDQPYSMPNFAIHTLGSTTMCQHDFEGRRIFQHRNCAKWDLGRDNRHIAGFFYENECREYLKILRESWDEWRPKPAPATPKPEKPKYFQEALENNQYDARFFRGELGPEERQAVLLHLLEAFTKLGADLHARPILMHGGLIGWQINRKMLPWDNNIELCLSLLDLQLLEACKPAYDEEKFLFDINPFYCDRATSPNGSHENVDPNKIDARFIDKKTGVFLDITALADEGETVATKCPHRYRKEMIFPLQKADFQGINVFVPANVPAVLIHEYGPAVLSSPGENQCGYAFDPIRNEYCKVP